MSAVTDAVALVEAAKIESVDNVEAYAIPTEIVDSDDVTVVLVTDGGNVPTAYGNDDFHRLDTEVEVQVFYSLDFERDPEEVEIELMKTFKHDGWTIAAVRQRAIDPDVGRLFNTFYFDKVRQINE